MAVEGVAPVAVDGVAAMVGETGAAILGDAAGHWDALPAQIQNDDVSYVADNVDYLLGGTVVTIQLTAIAVVLGLALGFPMGIVEVYAPWVVATPIRAAGIVVRATPILIIFVFIFFVFPLTDSAFTAAIVGLGVRSGAYQSQIFKGALRSVGEGQMEAARSVGLSKYGAIRHVVVPQALRRSIPSFQNEMTIVLKDTSIAIILGVSELLGRTQDLYSPIEWADAALELLLFASVVYFVLTFGTNRALDYLGETFAIPTGEGA